MKSISILIISLLIGCELIQAQVSGKLGSFKEKVLPRYSMYFDQAEITDNGHLNLSATVKYVVLLPGEKKAMMNSIIAAWKESLILVHYDSKRELWGLSSEAGSGKMLDKWDLNAKQIEDPSTEKAGKTTSHPWFLYLGGQGLMDSNSNINLSFNTRLGFFLLLNKWDLAATYSINMSGNTKNTDNKSNTSQSNIGLASKIYFPIKQYRISPNIGAEISLASPGNNTQTINESLLFGINWYVGMGSLDLGFRAGNEFTIMIGYTFMPKFKKNK